ncbi:Pkinase-domain-containing protein [Hesseltinella vesiculosa]|uniref:Pkinase-domain-containing protein n=1 Tax=Hesseltinella vesiculosa TaxID=101127 RepID=A0A1X2GSA0_9FUNG|nr:Pkinase-domain-containing protein [Hesseltinella vesiculosa]
MTDVNVPIQHSSTLFYKNTLRRRKEIGDYWLGRTLGKGSSGRVKLGYHKITGEKVAVKIISKSYLASSTSTERSVKREIAIMKLIQHPHILRLVDVIDLPESSNLYLILEYVQGGELFEYLVQQGRLSEIEARTYFRQIIFGIDYCHRHLICHRDLKPENLLLDDHCNIKIADFGMASLQPSGAFLETSCGSPHYASPEVVAGIPYNGIASDIWSCGVILYALLCGHLPFDDNDIRELLRKMHQLQQHAWFNGPSMSKQPVLPPLPTPDDLARPVCQVSDLDDRLLDTMKTLWADRSTVDLIHALMDNSYNMEKVTYMLLLRHAKTYFAGNDRAVEQQKKKPRPTTICGWNTGQHQPSFSTVTFNSPDPIQQQHMRRTSLADASSSTL